MDDFSGDVVVYQSIDTVLDQNAMTYPTKFLNSLEFSGMPPHILKLKVGAPVMVLQISIHYTSSEVTTGTTLGVSLLNHSSISRARVRHANA